MSLPRLLAPLIVCALASIQYSAASAQAIAREATQYFIEGNYREAYILLKQATQAKPNYVEAWVGRGMSAVKLGHLKEAQHAYEQALFEHEKRFKLNVAPDQLQQQLYILCLLGRVEEARSVRASLLALLPTDRASEVASIEDLLANEYRIK